VNPAYAKCLASSVWELNPIGHGVGRGRLDSSSAWAAINSVGQWWQMDLGHPKLIIGVVTQARSCRHYTYHRFSIIGLVRTGSTCCNEFVKSYKVSTYGGSGWTDVDGGHVFTANTANDANHISTVNNKVENKFASVVYSQYVRVVVQAWQNHIAMRAAVLVGACTFGPGDGTSVDGGSETYVGTAYSNLACESMVLKKAPTANGATRGTSNHRCYAEFKMTGVQPYGTEWVTCRFPSHA